MATPPMVRVMGWKRAVLWLWNAFALAQDQPSDPYAAARQKMEQAIQLQRAAIRKQLGLPEASAQAGFFTLPWPAPSSTTSLATDCEPVAPEQLDAVIAGAARDHGLTPDLLRAVIARESGFRPCAVSPKGAMGLMQLMPDTANQLALEDPFAPEENIRGGAAYLGWLLRRYSGDLVRALAAYNAGPRLVDFYEGLPPIPETINYVRDILQALQESSPKRPARRSTNPSQDTGARP